MKTIIPGTIIEKPWGYEKWIECNEHYVVRELFIREGEAVSLQYHEEKIETLYVLEGEANYTFEKPGKKRTETIIGLGTILKHLPYEIHRQRAITDFRFIEVSTPQLEDIIRLEDE